DGLEGLEAVAGGVDGEAEVLEVGLEELEVLEVVVHHKDGGVGDVGLGELAKGRTGVEALAAAPCPALIAAGSAAEVGVRGGVPLSGIVCHQASGRVSPCGLSYQGPGSGGAGLGGRGASRGNRTGFGGYTT